MTSAVLAAGQAGPRPTRRPVSGRQPVLLTPGTPVLDVVIPVYNEQDDLAACVERLHEHLSRRQPFAFRITVADNASTDATADVAAGLARRYDEVVVRHLGQKGRGRALRAAWSGSDAPVLVYMDVDLSTDLAGLLPLVAPLVSGHSDLAIGTRLARGARIVRGPKRDTISRSYNALLRTTLRARFSDAQCGFKAIRADVAAQLLPLVADEAWFFDTELLVIAERAGLRIHEVPVDWVDDPQSSVDVFDTAKKDLAGMWRLGRGLATGAVPVAALRAELGRSPLTPAVEGVPPGLVAQAARFVGVGVVSTAAYLLLFVLLRGSLGAQPANALALLVTAVANTAANRRLTFGIRGRGGVRRQQAQGLVVFAIAVAVTSGSLAALHAGEPHPARWVELTVLIAANLVATALRFVLLRAWVFAPSRRPA